jgi:hypothetical protein
MTDGALAPSPAKVSPRRGSVVALVPLFITSLIKEDHMRRIVKLGLLPVLALVLALGVTSTASAVTPTPYFQGFETDTFDWSGVTRVASGTNGVPSADGDWHAEAAPGAFTRWGHYSDEFPAGGWTTAVDIYLDPATSAANDTRFDWSSAVSTPALTHRRDFVFTGGFYDDTTGPGAGTDRFVISASNGAGRGAAFPKNPARDPFVIDEAGWYTFQHDFYDDGSGVLAVDLSILDADGNVLHTWTLSDPSDVIGTTVGGNRYGWFVSNEFGALAIDNARLDVQVGPPASKDECKNGGWQQFNSPTFKNQGDCVSFVATGGRNGGNG